MYWLRVYIEELANYCDIMNFISNLELYWTDLIVFHKHYKSVNEYVTQADLMLHLLL
jgi:hypothetical protein